MNTVRSIGRYIQLTYLLMLRFGEALFAPGLHPNPSKLELWVHQRNAHRVSELDIDGFGKGLRSNEAFRRRVEEEIATWREEEALIVQRCRHELEVLASSKKVNVQRGLEIVQLTVVTQEPTQQAQQA